MSCSIFILIFPIVKLKNFYIFYLFFEQKKFFLKLKNIKIRKIKNMGFIFSKIYEYFSRSKNNFKLVILGLQNAGKTTILYRM